MATTDQPRASALDDRGLADAVELIRMLADEIGPRRPTSEAESKAARALADWLAQRSISGDLQGFRGYASGGYSHGAIFGSALAGALVQRRRPWLGAAVAVAALAAATLEADTRWRPVSKLLSRRPSANLTATIAPSSEQRQRIVLVGHMDTTRSGLIFHPAVIGQLDRLTRIPAVATALVAAAPLGGRRARTVMRRAGIAGLILTLALLTEREMRGQDVDGANDNASGTAVAMQLAAELAATPLRHTRVDLLITGCEESWMLGAEAYLDTLGAPSGDAAERPLFLNFDTVGGPDVPLTYIEGEGMARPLKASARLIGLLDGIATQRPELKLRPAAATAGLPTDVTAALARGYEGVTLLAQGGQGIPNYHWPTDTFANLDRDTVWRTLETGRALVAELDREVGSGPN